MASGAESPLVVVSVTTNPCTGEREGREGVLGAEKEPC